MRIPLRSLLLDLLLTQTRSKMSRFSRFPSAMGRWAEFVWLFEDEGTGGFGGFAGGGIAMEDTEEGLWSRVGRGFEGAGARKAGKGHFRWDKCETVYF